MRKKQSSIDGFMPRRSGAPIGDFSAPRTEIGTKDDRRDLSKKESKKIEERESIGNVRGEIDESLRGIDDAEEEVSKKQRKRRQRGANPRRRKIIKRVVIFAFVALLLVAGFVGIKALLASSNIFSGNMFGLFQSKPLKMDENGRSNILVFGTSGTEKDQSHPGANLTDTIIVISVDQNKHNAYMMSVPRDLYVDYGGACPEGYQGKINSLYECRSDGGKNEATGARALKQKVGEVLGLDIQYYAHVNWAVLQESVEAVGGIDVKIESDDPRGILDRNFDWKCNYQCYFVNYKQGEVVHLDGVHALALARARNAAGGYGLSGGNFDREKNQQKIIKALVEKASSAGTLTNVGKVTSLIDALGNNLETSFQTSEIRTLMELGRKINADEIKTISFVKEDNPLVTTGNIGGASIVQPTAGLYDYSHIKAYVDKQLTANPVTREGAQVVILNGTKVEGLGTKKSEILEKKGFTILQVANAPAGDYEKVVVYQFGEGMPATKSKLKQFYGDNVIKQSAPPFYVNEAADFVIVYGANQS